MNWDAIAAVAELLSAFGVIASLIYLAVQIRGRAAQARQAAVRSVIDKINSTFDAVVGAPGFSKWWAGRGSWFSTAFQEHISSVMPDVPVYQTPSKSWAKSIDNEHRSG